CWLGTADTRPAGARSVASRAQRVQKPQVPSKISRSDFPDTASNLRGAAGSPSGSLGLMRPISRVAFCAPPCAYVKYAQSGVPHPTKPTGFAGPRVGGSLDLDHLSPKSLGRASGRTPRL